MEDTTSEMQLSKFLATFKLGTRREVSAIIKAGKVSINGAIEKQPFVVVKTDDIVTVGGKTISLPVNYVYFCVNKPKDLTTLEIKDKRSVSSMVSAKTQAKVSSIDSMGENDLGLGILTDDKELMAKLKDKPLLSHYKVSFDNIPDKDALADQDQIKFLGIDSEITIANFSSRLDPMTFRERFSTWKDNILSIDRVQLGSITKKDLPRGWNRPLTEKEVIFIKHF